MLLKMHYSVAARLQAAAPHVAAADHGLRAVLNRISELHALDESDVDRIRQLADIRNAVLHGVRDITTEDVESLINDMIPVRARLELALSEYESPSDDLPQQNDMTCFVIGPIGNRLAPIGSLERARYESSLRVWEHVIRPACRTVGLEPVRADTIVRAGEITDQVFRYLRDADLVIADLTSGNPNVMYELGLRHTTGKPTIQVGESGRLPFDVNVIRTILFSTNELGLIEAREQLRAALDVAVAGQCDTVSASRIWQEGVSLSQIQELEAIEDEEPGFIDMLADAEEAMPAMGETLEGVTTILETIASLTDATTAEIHESDRQGKGMSGRLVLTRKLAATLAEPAAQLKQSAQTYSLVMKRIQKGMDLIIEELEANPEQLAEAGEFPDQIVSLANNAEGSIEATKQMVEATKTTGSLARDLRKPTRDISNSLELVIEASQPILLWRERLNEIRRRAGGIEE